jgi:hypothetical protein
MAVPQFAAIRWLSRVSEFDGCPEFQPSFTEFQISMREECVREFLF